MARLKTHLATLACTPRAQSYFTNNSRPYLMATLECTAGLGIAEYAPLRGIHKHDVFEVKAMLDALSPRELDMLLAFDLSLDCFELAKIFKKNWPYPLSWVLSCLLYSLNLPKNILSQNKIKLSGLILQDVGESREFIANNYNFLKLKIGANIGEEIIKIESLKSYMPKNMRLRLDANRRLSLEDSAKLVRGIGLQKLEYFEEPLAEPRFLSHFFDNYGLACALDESWCESSSWEEIESTKARYLIIKPSRFSSIYHVIACAREALLRNIKPILSTCFESPYSTALYALLAANLDILEEAHGIWAEGFFSFNKSENPFINAPGHIYLSQALSYMMSLEN